MLNYLPCCLPYLVWRNSLQCSCLSASQCSCLSVDRVDTQCLHSVLMPSVASCADTWCWPSVFTLSVGAQCCRFGVKLGTDSQCWQSVITSQCSRSVFISIGWCPSVGWHLSVGWHPSVGWCPMPVLRYQSQVLKICIHVSVKCSY